MATFGFHFRRAINTQFIFLRSSVIHWYSDGLLLIFFFGTYFHLNFWEIKKKIIETYFYHKSQARRKLFLKFREHHGLYAFSKAATNSKYRIKYLKKKNTENNRNIAQIWQIIRQRKGILTSREEYIFFVTRTSVSLRTATPRAFAFDWFFAPK